jgi:hypothetical protein
MSWSKTGIGVAKVWEQGALDVGGDIYESGTKLSSKYLGISAKAADSEKLDGSDSTEYVKASTMQLDLNTLIYGGGIWNSTDGWVQNGAAYLSASDGILTLTEAAQYANVYKPLNVGVVSGHKYYIKYQYKINTATVSTLLTGISGVNLPNVVNATPNVWHENSGIITLTNADNNNLVIQLNDATIGTTMNIKDVYVLDLTHTFGAGSEPIKSTIDTLLAYYPKGLLYQNLGIDRIEWGSNANGQYAKYPDGTLICWKQILVGSLAITTSDGGHYRSGYVQLGATPYNFHWNPVVLRTLVQGQGTYVMWPINQPGSGVTTANFGQLIMGAFASVTATNVYFNVIALGRWRG